MSQVNIKLERTHLITILGIVELNLRDSSDKYLDESLKTYIQKYSGTGIVRLLWELSEEAIHISDFSNNRQLSLYEGVENELILKNLSASTGIPKNSLYALCNLIHKTVGTENAINLLKKTLDYFHVSVVNINPDNIESYSFSYDEDGEVFVDVGTKVLDVKFLKQVLTHFDNVCKLHPLSSIADQVKLTNASRIE